MSDLESQGTIENISNNDSFNLESSTQQGLLDSLPEDLRNEASLQSFKDITGLAKSYVNAQRMIGNSIRIPGADTDPTVREEFYKKVEQIPGVVRVPNEDNPESWNEFYKKIGLPESPDKYKVNVPDLLKDPEASPLVNNFLEVSHKYGLNSKQAQGILEFYNNVEQQRVQNMEVMRTEAESQLKQLWGSSFDTNLAGAKAVFAKVASAMPEQARMLESIAGNNPALIHILAEYGKFMQENGSPIVENRNQFGKSSAEALDEANAIISNFKHPYHDKMHPDHDNAVRKVQQLYAIAYPSQDN